MGRFSFLKQKKFYINLIIIIILFFVLLWLTFRMLKVYTRHDKVYAMPCFIGLDYHEVERDYADDFNFILIDSVYPKGQTPGSIVQQDPLPGSKIKKGRNVYYIIVAETPEMTTMPNLKNVSLRQAIGLLYSNGLEVERLEYEDYFAKNAIIEQYYNGSIVKPETELAKGSKIVLHVGKGQDLTKVKVPNLIGKPAEEAQHLLNLAGLNLGKINYYDNDSIQYQRIMRMKPGPSSDLIELGSYIDLWFHSEKTFDFDKELRNLMRDDSINNAPQIIEDESIETESTETETIETTDLEYEDEF